MLISLHLNSHSPFTSPCSLLTAAQLQTKLVGTVTVGNCLAKRIIASQTIQDPSIIVYDKREPWPASMIGAYSSEGSGFPGLDAPVVVPDVRPTLQDAWPIPISGPEVYFSAAQLDAVRRATVFSQDAKCTGIVFLYENGGEAAVGRCSPGYGETREYHDPEYICVKTSSTADGRNSATYHAAVLFSKAREHTGAAPQTACCRRMSGKSLRFWYSHKSTCLELMGPEGSEALAVQ